MKKVVLGLAAVTALTAGLAVSASAANVSGVNIDYTDTEAFINNVPIMAFMAHNDTTVVRTRDLADYGFNEQWDPNRRAVYISINDIPGIFNTVKAWNNGIPAWNNWNSQVWDASTGAAAAVNNSAYAEQLYRTSVPSDIKVFMNGTEVPSYNTGVETFVRLRDLVYAGQGIHKYWDPVRNASWVNVDAIGTPAMLNTSKQPVLSTREALNQAMEYIDENYDGLVVPNAGADWRAVYVDTTAPEFSFPVETTADYAGGKIIVGTVTVTYDNGAVIIDKQIDDGIAAWAKVVF